MSFASFRNWTGPRLSVFLASVLIGTGLLAFMAYLVLYPPEFSDETRGIVRFFIALAAALATTLVSGSIVGRGSIGVIAIEATGGILVFVLVMFVVDPIPSSDAKESTFFQFNLALNQEVKNYTLGIDPVEYEKLKSKNRRLSEELEKRARQAYERGTSSLEKAKEHFAKDSFLTAISFLEEAAPLLESSETYGYLASAHLAVGNQAEATENFEKAIALDSSNGRAWEGLSLVQSTTLQYRDALDSVNKAITLLGEDCELLARHGYASLMLGNFVDAKASFDRGLLAGKPCIQAAIGMTGLLVAESTALGMRSQDQFKKILFYISIAHKIDPSNPWVVEFSALVLGGAKQGMREPKKPDAIKHLNLAEKWFAGGRLKEALAEYKKAVAIEPESDMIHLFMGDAYFGLRDFDEAIRRYKEAIRLNGENFRAWRFLGDTYERLGRLLEAREAYENSVAINPDYLLAKTNLMRVKRKIDRADN